MKRGLLLIDRGSREKEAKEELEVICKKVKEKGSYVFSEYCFLEVIPPYIEDGMKKCLNYELILLPLYLIFFIQEKKLKQLLPML